MSRRPRAGRYDLLVMGCSLGGVQALVMILSAIPDRFTTPIAIVHHRHRSSGDPLLVILRRASLHPLMDAEDKLPIERSRVYVAPADYHLLVEQGSFHLSIDAPENYSRPSVDLLFETAASAYGERCAGVILTGANGDGAKGAAQLKLCGGFLVVQDPATAEARSMPLAALDATHPDRVLPLDRIGPFLVELCHPQ